MRQETKIYCMHCRMGISDEHYDGSGYPRGLKGKEVTLGSRIFSVCDMLDALTVERTYRKAITFEEAKKYILSASGTLFDPDIIKKFLRVEDDIKELISKILLGQSCLAKKEG